MINLNSFQCFKGIRWGVGLNGRKTLVLLPAMMCSETSCPWFKECTDGIKHNSLPYNSICPFLSAGARLQDEPTEFVKARPKSLQQLFSLIGEMLDLSAQEVEDRITLAPYIQHMVRADKGWREPSSKESDSTDKAALISLCIELKPDLIIAVGAALSRKLRQDFSFRADRLYKNTEGSLWRLSLGVDTDNHNVTVATIPHPLSPAWSLNKEKFGQYLKQALNMNMNNLNLNINNMKVYFEPHVGKVFFESKVRLMVISDSHYCGECGECGVRGNCPFSNWGDCSVITQNAVREYLEFRQRKRVKGDGDGWMTRSYLPFEKLLKGEDVTPEESLDFWNHIALYTFVQTATSASPDNRNYTDDDYKKSAPFAWKVINSLRPDYVLVWGNKAYNALPSANWSDGSDYYNGYYTLNDGHIVRVLRIHHPSRASRPIWREIIAKFLGSPKS